MRSFYFSNNNDETLLSGANSGYRGTPVSRINVSKQLGSVQENRLAFD